MDKNGPTCFKVSTYSNSRNAKPIKNLALYSLLKTQDLWLKIKEYFISP